MFRKLTLFLFLTVSAFLIGNISFANLITVNGGSTPYTLANGDTLFIQSGTYTGNIGGFAAGATIIVSDLATFQPTGMSHPNVRGTMYVYGTFIMNNNPQFRTNTDFTIHNYGTVQINYETRMDGSNQTWTNHYGGIINFSGNVLMNGDLGNNNVLINYETINANGDFQMNSGSAVNNYKDINVAGNYRVNGGTLDNQGNLFVTGNILMNNGASIIRNWCRMEASNGITNTSGNFYNYSYLRAINSDITNSANIFNVSVRNFGAPLSKPMIEGRNYFHSTGGTMTGPALLYFTGTTSITGGTIGVSGATTDTIKMNDITRSSPTQILDVQSGGTIYPNVIYNAWGVPDPTVVYLFGCALEIFLEVPLAINWKSFDVILSNDIPLLLWSAEFDHQTVFEIQRSYDGRNFSTIDQVASIDGKKDYRYSDRSVNNQSTFVYYRIKAIELGGIVKYSQVRIVRFSRSGAIVQTAPNPFKNNFNIFYQAAETANVTVRIFNVNGQQQLVKNVSVIRGSNNINIVEVSTLASGMYVIQLSSGNNIISSSKIIKQ